MIIPHMCRPYRYIVFCILFWNLTIVHGQTAVTVANLSIAYDQPGGGFDILAMNSKDVVVVGEDTHNRIDMPRATLKLLQYLHKTNNTRVFVIEAGTSTAWLINRFLASQDTLLLRDIARHTFYWGIEHYAFWQELAKWNEQLTVHEKIKVVSADIEIKQESVVLALNILMQEKEIPSSMSGLKTLRGVFEETSIHRNQFNALNVRYYYDKDRCEIAAKQTLADINQRPDEYQAFFGSDLPFVQTMLRDLVFQYRYNYKDWNFTWRDKIIYQKLLDIHASGLTKFIYVVGSKHTGVGASSYRLAHDATSPFKGRVVLVNITGRKSDGKFEGAKVVTELSRQYPKIFCDGCDVIIRNDGSNELLKNYPDYTIAFKNNIHVRPFNKTFVGK
jgi:hypothetical protein